MMHSLMDKKPIIKEEWARRQAQAEEFRRLEVNCVMCAGAGGWLSMLPRHWCFARHAKGQGDQRALTYPQKAVNCESYPR